MASYNVSCEVVSHRVPRYLLERSGTDWAVDQLETRNTFENAMFWSNQELNCNWNEETGTAEWDMSGLVACEERFCSLTDEMLNASDLILLAEDGSIIRESGVDSAKPLLANAGTYANFTCSNGKELATISASFFFTPKWTQSCDGT